MSASMTEGTLHSEIKSGIAHIRFAHPQSNSLPGALLRQLAQSIDQVAQDKRAQVLFISSEGDRTFCAGASFDELLASTNLEQAEHFFSGFALVIDALRRCPKLSVCRVQGKAVGGGVGLLSACDYVLATKSAAIKLSELALGIGPFIIGPAVERKIGKAAFAEAAIDADWKEAEWAFGKGLYNQLYDSIESLDTGAQSFLEKLMGYSEPAMLRLKKVLWEGTEDWKALLFGRVQFTASLSLTPECRQRVESVKAK